MEKSNVMQTILTFIGAGGVAVLSGFFIGKKKRLADADSVEIDTSVKINREWQRLYEEIRDEFHEYKEENEKEMQVFRNQLEVLEDALILERKEVTRLRRMR